MKGKDTKQQKLFPLRKSSALILLYPSLEQKNLVYKTIILKRKSVMSFASSYAFPGGSSDPKDIQIACSSDFNIYSKITAIRQFLQETGILIYPASKDKIVKNSQFLDKNDEEISKGIGKIWNDSLGLLEPVLRLLTPQKVKGKRFDCLFHLCRIGEQVKVINIGYLRKKAAQSKLSIDQLLKQQRNNHFSHLTSTEIYFDKNQSEDIIFDSPQKIIAEFRDKKIYLYTPQLILMTSLMHLCHGKYKDQLKLLSSNASSNYFKQIQPIIFDLNFKNPTHFILFGDKSYNYAQILRNEHQTASKQSLRKHINSKIKQNAIKGEGKRIIVAEPHTYMISSYPEEDKQSMIGFLPTQPHSNVTSRQMKPKL